MPLAGHIPYRHIHRHIHRHAGHLRGVAGEAWRADCGSRANLGVQGTADADRRRRFGSLATEGALWAPWHSFRTWTRSSAVSRRCSSSSSSSGSSLSAVSVPTPASSAVNVITVVTPTNQPTNLIPTPLGRYPRTACSLHSRYSTYTRYFLVGVTSVITVTVAGVWAGTEAAQRGWLPLRQQQQQRQWRSR